MGLRRIVGGVPTTFSTVVPTSAADLPKEVFVEDFFASQASSTGDRWTIQDSSAGGNTTPIITGAASVLSLPLDATNEAQSSGIYLSDNQMVRLDRGAVMEMFLAFAVLPTAGTDAVFGLGGPFGLSFDAVEGCLWFKCDGSGAVLCEMHDGGANYERDVATGVTLVAGEFHLFRIDASDRSDCKFFIDGVRVASGTSFDMSDKNSLQPFFCVHKSSGTSLGNMHIDFIRITQDRV